MNLSPGYLWASIVCAVAVAFLILLSIIDKRTPPPNVPFVPYEPPDDTAAWVLARHHFGALSLEDDRAWRGATASFLDDYLDPEREVLRLEMFMLTAISKGDKALAAYVEDRDGQHLINGLLDMRNRLAQGLDMEPDELAARLDEERQPS